MSHSLLHIAQFLLANRRLGLCIAAVHAGYAYGTQKETTVCVKETYQLTRSGASDLMLVDETGAHFRVHNSFWMWKWDSVEDWKRLTPGEHYRLKYYGLRVPMLGMWPNVFFSQNQTPLVRLNQRTDACRPTLFRARVGSPATVAPAFEGENIPFDPRRPAPDTD